MIRKIYTSDYPRLTAIWESAVRNTHDFLQEEDFRYYQHRLPAYFPHVTLFGFEQGNILVGFMGVADGNLEMLFVDNEYRGMGIGKQLIGCAIAELHVTKVDVNEQNTSAVGFYRKMGFIPRSRSLQDAEGKAYPILHMQLSFLIRNTLS